MQSLSRGRLLAGAAIGLGLSLIAPQQAQAACTLVAGNLTCTNTTTVDTQYPTNVATGTDRSYTDVGVETTTVGAGVTVDGFGLAIADSTGNTFVVTNDGVIQVNAGNTPVSQFSGQGALNLATNADAITYSGTGDILNLGTGEGFFAHLFTGGSLNATFGGSVRADNGDAIRVLADDPTTGVLNIITTAGETIRASGGDGIEIDTAGSGNVGIINAATISSGGAGVNTLQDGINVASTGTGGITISNTGAIGASGDRAQLTGISETITNAASAGTLSVSGTGAIFSVGNAIDLSTDGTGSASVVYGGALDTTAGDGVQVNTTTGPITVTTGGTITAAAGDGIDATSTTGTQTLTANGAITASEIGIRALSTSGDITANVNASVTGTNQYGVYLASGGLKDVNVAAGATVTGGTAAIQVLGAGAATIDNSGTLGTALTGSVIAGPNTAVTINNLSGGTVLGNVILSDLADAINNSGTFNLINGSLFGAGADTVTNNSGGVLNVSGTVDFGADADAINNLAGGTVNIAAGTTLTGLETVSNAGTFNANAGLTLDAGNTAVTNTGTFNAAGTLDFGAGTDSFANSGSGIFNLTGATTLAGLETFTNTGRINLNTFTLTGPAVAFTNSGFIDTSGAAGLGGFTSVSNAGTLDLAPGIFTVPAGVFTNTGLILADEGASTITGQTSFANSGTIDLQDGAVNDTLTINSAFVGSGGSSLLVDFNETASDLLVINGAASGTTSIAANYLGTGLFNLDGVLVVDAVSATPNAFVLGSVSGNTSPLVDFSLVQNGGEFLLVSAPNASAFDPLAIPVVATSLWYQSADEVLAETHKPATTSGLSFWGDLYYSQDEIGDDDSIDVDGTAFDVDHELETKRHGIQLGVDYGFGGGRVGVTGGYAWAKSDNDDDALSDIGLKAKGWNLGLYGQFGGITGFHGEFLLKHDRYDAEFDDGVFDGEEFDIKETGVDGSVGYRFGLGGDANLDASVGVSHVRTKIDDIDAFGVNYDINTITSTRGRAGLRAVFGGGLAPYIDGTVYREFDGDADFEVFDGADTFDLDTDGKATWVRLEAGLSGNDGPGPILALWGDLGDKQGFGVRAGWRLGGRVAEAAPPPPPPPTVVAPPPPPPPATQTCPDGSVILATDACPPPPPPPPPPPEPERG